MPLNSSLFPARSDAFAFLVPLSADSTEAIEFRVNRSLLEDARPADGISLGASKVGQKCRHVARLDYNLLFGRRCLSFGSSRSNEFRFPQAEDVGEHQFILHFEMHTAILLLTDNSPSGTWVFDGATQKCKLLHNTTYPLLHSSCIRFGEEHRYRFRIEVAACVRDSAEFSKLFEDYARSIGWPAPAFVRSIALIRTPLEILDNRYVQLHRVGQGENGVVHACLRTSDGTLVAVRRPFQHLPDDEWGIRAAINQRVQEEAWFLSQMRHVSDGIGFASQFNNSN